MNGLVNNRESNVKKSQRLSRAVFGRIMAALILLGLMWTFIVVFVAWL